ncbi:MAG: hypothetical protein SNG27_05345 [Rikenellaceae bacterium]
MAGELSKRIGEIGEDTVSIFLKLIGWGSPIKNFDLPCTNSQKHQCKTHGVDGYFHYKSPLIANTLENILISVKYSSKNYGGNIISDFKNNYNDITSAIECFKLSEIRNDTNNSYSDIQSVFDRGLIFKINNSDDLDANIIERLSNIEVPYNNTHDGVVLIDNSRINYLYNAISFVKQEYCDSEVQFVYFNTGLNSNDQSVKSGSVLPFQYLASDIIPFRIQSTCGKITLLICTRDKFSEEELLKLLGLAKNSGLNLQQDTVIAFPDYNQLNHEHSVAKVIQMFKDDANFTLGISIKTFNRTFRQ